MQVPVTFWTSAAALVVSLITASVTFLQAVRGPQIQMLPLDSVFVFASPDGPELLGAVLQTDIANVSEAYPDMLVSHEIVILAGEEERACLSPRGEARFHSRPGQVAGQHPLGLEIAEAAEVTTLTNAALELRDVSSRGMLPAGAMLSRRQLFDQLANRSDANTCRHFHGAVLESPYTTADFIQDFRGREVLLRYTARFVHVPAFLVDCRFELTDTRADRLLTRGWINVPLGCAPLAQMPNERSWWQRALDRLL